MAAKREEYKLNINGVETTMLLDSEDAERYRAAGVLVEDTGKESAAKVSDGPVDVDGNAPATKAIKSPQNK